MRLLWLCMFTVSYLVCGSLLVQCVINPNKRDCSDFPGQNGTFLINIAHAGDPPLYRLVYCEDGWMILLRRYDGSVNFSRLWAEYKEGFGQPGEEMWAGNELTHRVTIGFRSYKMRVDLELYNGTQGFVEYGIFSVGPESSNYTLSVGGWSSFLNFGDSFSVHDGWPFSTLDKITSQPPCPIWLGGAGWWFTTCGQVLLTGMYGETPPVPDYFGILWAKEVYDTTPVAKAVTMKIHRQ